MVVEHIFITTMEPAEAISAAGEMLSRHQFVAAGRQGFAISNDAPATAEFIRQKKSQFMRVSNNNLLRRGQKVRLDFDRGRVTVAVAMDDPHSTDITVTKGGSIFGRKRRRLADLQQRYLIGIASALEARLLRRDRSEVAEQAILRPVHDIETLVRQQRRNAIVLLLLFGLLIAACIAYAVVGSSRR